MGIDYLEGKHQFTSIINPTVQEEYLYTPFKLSQNVLESKKWPITQLLLFHEIRFHSDSVIKITIITRTSLIVCSSFNVL